MFNIGMPELILILVIALVVFGPGKLPEIGQSLGKSIREFKRAMTQPSEAEREAEKKQPPKKTEDEKKPEA